MSEMVEQVARALCELKYDSQGGWAMQDDLAKQAYRSGARAAIEAMREPTVEMVVKAFPCEREESLDVSAKKMGAAACMAMSGGKDIGLLEGEAVKQAAFLVRDYRLMIDAALDDPRLRAKGVEV